MTHYLSPDWQAILAFNQLDNFDAFWQLEADWFEEPNHRRGGWSGVSRILLALPEGGEAAVFLKRQENHLRKTIAHPLKGIPTFRAEIDNTLKLRQLGILAMEPVYYAERQSKKGWQCVLLTNELTGYLPLDKVIDRWQAEGWAQTSQERQSVLLATAQACAQLHRHRLVHRALHAKHVFVNREMAQVCFIDLEKMRTSWSRRQATLRDLDSLNRHVQHVNRSDRLRFLLAYFDLSRTNNEARKVWHALAAKQNRK